VKYIALICARGGSKGLPDKNILPLAGVPLIGWAIKAAKNVERISRVIVSTDSEQIAQIAKEFGAEVPFMRPGVLSGDNSPEWLVWKHAVEYLEKNIEFDGLVVIPTTAPLRNIEDINLCINKFEKGKSDIVITVTEAHRSPYFNMVKIDVEGNTSLVIQNENKFTRRQDSPQLFDVTTVAYVVKPTFVKENEGIFEGRVASIEVPAERAIDIDSLMDFKIAECLFNSREGDFV
jgi:CMP-N-acetylneuraminic acid synthetase